MQHSGQQGGWAIGTIGLRDGTAERHPPPTRRQKNTTEGAYYVELSTIRIVVIGSPLEATLVLGDASKCNIPDVVFHA